MTTIRTDVVKLGDTYATLIGDDVAVGQLAPEFTSSEFNWAPVNPITESRGKVAILSAVPSLDTNVCQEAAALSDDIIIWTISTDFPMAQKRWCGAAGVERVRVVSDVLNAEFGKAYGLLVVERRYLRRAVFVVNREGVLTYVAYMHHNGLEPDYDEVIQAAQDALHDQDGR